MGSINSQEPNVTFADFAIQPSYFHKIPRPFTLYESSDVWNKIHRRVCVQPKYRPLPSLYLRKNASKNDDDDNDQW